MFTPPLSERSLFCSGCFQRLGSQSGLPTKPRIRSSNLGPFENKVNILFRSRDGPRRVPWRVSSLPRFGRRKAPDRKHRKKWLPRWSHCFSTNRTSAASGISQKLRPRNVDCSRLSICPSARSPRMSTDTIFRVQGELFSLNGRSA